MADSYGQPTGRWDSTSWSLVLFRSVFGIRVRLHWVFLLFVVFRLFQGYGYDALPLTVVTVTLLFVIVLLHEFGHCFGCRWVGGRANDILMWPLGGLAYCDPPHRPIENLVTTLAGPAVNVFLCLTLLPILGMMGLVEAQLFNPWHIAVSGQSYAAEVWLYMAFKVSYWLLLFNMLPIYPFDGGRVLQEILWLNMSYYQSTQIATTVGMVGAVLMAGISLWHRDLMLTCIAAYGLMVCWQVRREQEMMGQMPENEFGYDFSQGYTSLERSMPGTSRPAAFASLTEKLRSWSNNRQEKQTKRLEAEVRNWRRTAALVNRFVEEGS